MKSINLSQNLGVVALSIAAALAAGCADLPQLPSEVPMPPIPVTMIAAELGSWAFEFTLATSTVSPSNANRQLVSRVMQRVTASISDKDYPKARKIKWNVQVVEDTNADASAFPGGGVLISTGLLKEGSEDTIAVALGHEVAHVLSDHFARRLEQDADLVPKLAEVIKNPAWKEQGLPTELRVSVLVALGASHELGTVMPFVREQELAADKLGTLLMASAGYDARAAITFWEKAARKPKESTFFSTHPSDAERIAALNEFVPTLPKPASPATARAER